MTPAMLALVFSLVEEAIKVTPGLVTDIQTLFANGTPSPEDWQALRTKVLSQSFESLAPNAAANLPPQ